MSDPIYVAESFQKNNVVGTNKAFGGPGWDFIKQGGPLSVVLNAVPGINAIGRLDDTWQNNLENYFLLPITIPGAVLITVPALIDQAHIYRPFDRPSRYRE